MASLESWWTFGAKTKGCFYSTRSNWSDALPYVLEANPNPRIQCGDEFPDSAEAYGLNYKELISKLVSLGISWNQSRK